MMKLKLVVALVFLISLMIVCCNNSSVPNFENNQQEGTTIATRFNTPNGFVRINENQNSFGHYLRNLPLKKSGTLVKYFNGQNKDDFAYCGVVNLPIGCKDLHQCADAVMRLRAEYLYKQKQYDKIHFNFTNGFKVEYSKWMQGYRIAVNGNKTSWIKKAKSSNSEADFWKYLEQIFQYAGTASLEKEMKQIPVSDIQIGDVFIKGGFPGHAVIVVDMAKNANGKKMFMLAQSYMPAQELQILKNVNNSDLSPWYSEDFGEILETPEWTFKKSHLRRF